MAHVNTFDLKIGGEFVRFSKSQTIGGIQYANWVNPDKQFLQNNGLSYKEKSGSFFLFEFQKGRMENDMDEIRLGDNTISISSHTYFTKDSEEPVIPTGLINIRLKDHVNEKKELDKILNKFHLRYDGPYIAGTHNVWVTKNSKNPMKVAKALQRMKRLIDLAEPELQSRAMLSDTNIPTDFWIKYQWHLENRGEFDSRTKDFKKGADARVLKAWKEFGTLGDPNIIVAVLDNGFDLAHEDLDSPGKVVWPKNFFDDSKNPHFPSHSEQAADHDGDGVKPGHGTACAGLAVGNANNEGVVGVAPNCRLMPLKFTFNLAYKELNRQLEYILEKKPHVLSCSWEPKASKYELNTTTKELLRLMAEAGIVICFAAGNKGKNIKERNKSYYNGFANNKNVIAISAIDHKEDPYEMSNRGKKIAVCAPAGTVTIDISGRPGNPDALNHNFGQTSCATAIVAGVCALVKSMNPNLTGHEVKQIIIDSARKLVGQTQHRNKFGHGCVNAFRALEITRSKYNGVV